jgi:hypothetical protein
MGETTRANAAQTAANAAASLFQGTGNVEGFGTVMQRIAKFVVAFGEIPLDTERQANAIATAQANLAQGGVQATVSRDLSTDEARWQDALNNSPNDWYNNVGNAKASSGGGIGPDFRFKKDEADVTPLWLNGKYGPAPAWVFEKLGLQFPGGAHASAGVVTAPVAPTAAPVAQTPVPPDEIPF